MNTFFVASLFNIDGKLLDLVFANVQFVFHVRLISLIYEHVFIFISL